MIVSFYAGLLALLYFKLSVDVIKARRLHKVSLGCGPNDEIAAVISAHANFAAYVPLLLLLLWMVETSTVFPSPLVHAIGMSFTVGRLLHYLAFTAPKMNFRLRVVGMHLTLWPLIVLACLNVYLFVRTVI